MKISKNNYRILELLKSGDDLIPSFGIKSFPQNSEKIKKNYKYYNNIFSLLKKSVIEKNKIVCISKPFFKAFDENKKVAEKLWNLRNEVESEIGVLLVPDNLSYFYYIDNNKELEKVSCIVFLFSNDTFLSFLELSYYYDSIKSENIMYINKAHSFDTIENDESYNVTYTIQIVISYILFKEYAEVELKYLDGKSTKRSNLNNEKIVNEIKFPIEYIDSTWFTTIVHSESFKVSGHFRLQPYGEKLAKRKLIYIEEYEKNGFIRKAKIENKE
jgi:hypothetical protein